jgi:uncharacterized protein YjiS (DUF1127 family)
MPEINSRRSFRNCSTSITLNNGGRTNSGRYLGTIKMQASFNTNSIVRAPHGIGSALSRLAQPATRAAHWIRERNQRRQVINELDRLSDRELADIGLARGDIRSVFIGAEITGR